MWSSICALTLAPRFRGEAGLASRITVLDDSSFRSPILRNATFQHCPKGSSQLLPWKGRKDFLAGCFATVRTRNWIQHQPLTAPCFPLGFQPVRTEGPVAKYHALTCCRGGGQRGPFHCRTLDGRPTPAFC